MSEFMPIGLLTDIAADFEVSESSAGLLISIYAWAVAILSLPIMLALRKMEFRSDDADRQRRGDGPEYRMGHHDPYA